MKALKALLGEFRSGQGLKGQLLRGGFWSLVIKILNTFMALGLAVVLARLLGPEGFGIYSFILALVSILAIPAQLGLPNLVVRETAKAQVSGQWDVMKGLWRWATLVALAMSAVLIVLGGIAAWALGDKLGAVQVETLWWGLALVPLVALGNLRGAALQGLRKVVQGLLPDTVVRPGLFILLVMGAPALFVAKAGPADAMMLHVIASAVAFAIGSWLLLANRPRQVRQARATIHSQYWRASTLPFALIVGVDYVSQNAALIVVGITSTPFEVALFKVAMQASMLVVFGVSTMRLILSPFIARTYAASDMRSLQKMLTANAYVCAAVAIPAVALFAVFGTEIIAILFGAEFAGASVILMILNAGNVVFALWPSANVLLNMSGHEREVMKISAISLMFTVSLLVILGAMWGVIGSAIASSSGIAFMSLMLARSAKKITNLKVSVF